MDRPEILQLVTVLLALHGCFEYVIGAPRIRRSKNTLGLPGGGDDC